MKITAQIKVHQAFVSPGNESDFDCKKKKCCKKYKKKGVNCKKCPKI